MSKVFVRANVTLEVGLAGYRADDKTLAQVKDEMKKEIERRLLACAPDPEADTDAFNGYRIIRTEVMQVNHE